MNIGDLVGAIIALITVSLCVVKLYDLYKYMDEFEKEETNEDSN